jgi:hypothetical protein
MFPNAPPTVPVQLLGWVTEIVVVWFAVVGVNVTVPVDAPGAMLAVGDTNEPAMELLFVRATSSGLLPAFPASGWFRPAIVGVLFPSFVSTSVITRRASEPALTLALVEPKTDSVASEIRIADGARVTESVPDPPVAEVAEYVTVEGEAPSPVANPVPRPYTQ